MKKPHEIKTGRRQIKMKVTRQIFYAPDMAGEGSGATISCTVNVNLINRFRTNAGQPPLSENRIRQLKELRPSTLWIIDDEPSVAEVLARLFDKKSIKSTVLTPDEFQKLIQTNAALPDVVITDFNLLPDMNGEQVIKTLKNKNWIGLVIGMSGGGSRNLTAFWDAGADVAFGKPVPQAFFELLD